jgi:sulfhydrogenase subunit alpha
VIAADQPAPVRTVRISHLGRIEGHGGITVRIAGREVQDVAMDVFEGSRYYEALLRGRSSLEVQGIISRVCAICSAGHTVAALGALENALGVEVSERVHHLRGLLVLGSTIESHALHVFALALPDFLGADSVLSLAEKLPGEVAFALRLKQLGNHVQELVGGRAIHPINTLVGGFGKIPSRDELRQLRTRLEEALPPLERCVELVAGLPVPEWTARDAVYMALEPYEPAYRFRGGVLRTSAGHACPVDLYREVVHEYTVAHSHAKHSVLDSRRTYMVGSLARLTLWAGLLEGRARAAYELLFPQGTPSNALLNTRAQLVELVHCVERAAQVCALLEDFPPASRELAAVEPRAGRGVGALEVPRGTLFHEYELDDEGGVTSANVVTPTAQNLAHLEGDLRVCADRLLAADAALSETALAHGLEMVARAYDPCVSCSVHVVRVA